jgi:hypothetical protein
VPNISLILVIPLAVQVCKVHDFLTKAFARAAFVRAKIVKMSDGGGGMIMDLVIAVVQALISYLVSAALRAMLL